MAEALVGWGDGADDIARYGSVFHLEDRNRLAAQVISEYAMKHACADVAIGVAGLVVPGGALLGMAASIAVQAPLIYQPMARRLAAIYTASADANTDAMLQHTVAVGAGMDVAAEFAAQFFQEIGVDLAKEAGLGFLLGAMPLVGPIVAAGLDAAIAATLTWRVGTMVAMYYQNGCRWVGDRKITYHRAEQMVPRLSPAPDGRADLNDIPARNQEILDAHVSMAAQIARSLMGLSTDRQKILETLRALGISDALARLAMARAFA